MDLVEKIRTLSQENINEEPDIQNIKNKLDRYYKDVDEHKISFTNPEMNNVNKYYNKILQKIKNYQAQKDQEAKEAKPQAQPPAQPVSQPVQSVQDQTQNTAQNQTKNSDQSQLAQAQQLAKENSLTSKQKSALDKIGQWFIQLFKKINIINYLKKLVCSFTPAKLFKEFCDIDTTDNSKKDGEDKPKDDDDDDEYDGDYNYGDDATEIFSSVTNPYIIKKPLAYGQGDTPFDNYFRQLSSAELPI